MSNRPSSFSLFESLRALALVCVAVFCLAAPSAHAGLTIGIYLNHVNYQSQYYYYYSVSLLTNSSMPDVPFGDYFVASPGYPTNGASSLYQYDATGFNNIGGGGSDGFDLFDATNYSDSFIQNLTNGTWSLCVTNSSITNVYYFQVTASIDTNSMSEVYMTYPGYNEGDITNQPTFSWVGPTNYNSINLYEGGYGVSLPGAQTNWPNPFVLNQGLNPVTVDYYSNCTPFLSASIPKDINSNPQRGWDWVSQLECSYFSQFSVGAVDGPGTPVSLVARYQWATTNSDGSPSGSDSSGNGLNMNFSGSYGSEGGDTWTTNAAEGTGAIVFHDGDANSAGYVGWSSTPTNILGTLAGSFSVACWIKTTLNETNDEFGGNDDYAYNGAGIVSADVLGLADDVIPMALTGDNIGFNTGGTVQDQTLNSVTPVNDGNYHHVVVTRNQITGQKVIYIDGSVDVFSAGTTDLLDAPQMVTIGALSEAGDTDPTNAFYYYGFDGQLDDLQIYSGVLSANDVASLYNNPGSIANNNGGIVGGHTNILYYSFEDNNIFANDFSGNNNGVDGVSWNLAPPEIVTNEAAAGTYSAEFSGAANGAGWFSIPTNVLSTLAGSFSASMWINTTEARGHDSDSADGGSGLLAANLDMVIPMALTGSKLAFLTGSGNPDSLHSVTSVNTGEYVHVVVTRDQATGLKTIYVNGQKDASDYGAPGVLKIDPNAVLFLGVDGPPANNYGGYTDGYAGYMDEVQIYSGVLSAGDVATLYSNPGTTVPDTQGTFTGPNFGPVLGATNLNWSTSGDTAWFVESTNTYNGNLDAAESGSVTNTQVSILSTTVTGPGKITFFWSSIANDPNNGFDCEFFIDTTNSDEDDIYNNPSWQQAGPFVVPAGPHVVGWAAFAYGDTYTNEAAFLDQVVYVPDTAPVITTNPLSQTNYSGYSLWLSASATGNPTPTWQWYEVGSGAIAGATGTSFIPTNAGTAGVAGGYYAVALNDAGSATTATAAVTFVSAPIPAGWSRAVRSPFYCEYGTNPILDYYAGCAADAGGNIYLANQYIGDVLAESNGITENTLTAVGIYGAADLVKNDPNGNLLWCVGLTNNDSGSYSYGNCVVLAPGNGAYLLSEAVGTNWIGTNVFTNNGAGSVLLSRFDANGNYLWSQIIGQTNLVFASYNNIVSDSSGNVTIGGFIDGPTSFGSTNLTPPSGFNGFLAQYNSNGTLQWAQLVSQYVRNMAEGGGRIYLSFGANTTGGNPNVSIGALSNQTDRAYGLAAIDAATGEALWVSGVGEQAGANTSGVGDDIPLVSVSGSDVFLTGTAYGSTAVFSNLSVSLTGGRSQYFARYDTNGNAQTAAGFGSSTTMPWASTASSSGVYIAGDFDDYSTFGDYTITAPEYTPSYLGAGYFTQPFVAKFDRNGNALWALNGVSPVLGNLRGVTTVNNGVWVSGFTQNANLNAFTQFGTNSVISDTYFQVYVGGSYLAFARGGVAARITETSGSTAQPVMLLYPQIAGGNFQFAFQSQAGFNHTVEYTTNLAAGVWLTNSVVAGDGTVKTNSVPLSVFSPSKTGFVRVSTE